MSNKSDKKAQKKSRIAILKERPQVQASNKIEDTIIFYEGEYASRAKISQTPSSHSASSRSTFNNQKKVTSTELDSHTKRAKKCGLVSRILYETDRVIAVIDGLERKYKGALNCLDLNVYAPFNYTEAFFQKVSFLLIELIYLHSTTLARKREMLLVPDDYGVIGAERWEQEKLSYIENSLCKAVLNLAKDSLTKEDLEMLLFSFGLSPLEELNFKSLSKTIDYIVDELPSSCGSESVIDTKSGHDYERFIAKKIKSLGYDAVVTKGSGDHGADIVVDMGGEKIVIQCKFYSSPVGNKAVQEVYSAMGIYDAEQAWVVTNHSFTPAAKIAAKKLGVLLIHHDELDDLLS